MIEKIAGWFFGRKLRNYLEEANKMGEKKWYTSKTIWANVLMGVAGVLTALTTDGGLSPKTVGILTTAGTLLNVVLRMVTDKPIEK